MNQLESQLVKGCFSFRKFKQADGFQLNDNLNISLLYEI